MGEAGTSCGRPVPTPRGRRGFGRPRHRCRLPPGAWQPTQQPAGKNPAKAVDDARCQDPRRGLRASGLPALPPTRETRRGFLRPRVEHRPRESRWPPGAHSRRPCHLRPFSPAGRNLHSCHSHLDRSSPRRNHSCCCQRHCHSHRHSHRCSRHSRRRSRRRSRYTGLRARRGLWTSCRSTNLCLGPSQHHLLFLPIHRQCCRHCRQRTPTRQRPGRRRRQSSTLPQRTTTPAITSIPYLYPRSPNAAAWGGNKIASAVRRMPSGSECLKWCRLHRWPPLLS
mmetsp:Transcript_34467/g.91000  ORF Transcript_34467/g.91000 Transcript_34467/m.91000 type:complete len:281 (+) Transcript_34467:310-1152(+)